MSIVSGFNSHLVDFFEDIQTIFPDNVDILTGKNSILAFKKVNPALIIRIWQHTLPLCMLSRLKKMTFPFLLERIIKRI